MPSIRRAALLALVAASSLPAQTSPSPAEARALELTTTLRLGRLDSLEAFIRRSFGPQFLGMAPIAQHLSFYQSFFDVAKGAERIGTRNVTRNAATAFWYSPLLEDWYGVRLTVDTVAPNGIQGPPPPMVTRAAPPDNAPPVGRAASDETAWKSLDAWVQRLADADRFSGVVLVARGNKVIGGNGYGDAAKEYGVRNTLATKMIMGSVPKMFTAVSILQLVEEGKLSLDDPVGRFLPGVLPSPGDTAIRIKHLLTHTAGLGDFLFTPEMMGRNRAQFRTVASYLPLLKERKPTFTPGTKWDYSNAGFLVLGAVLEKVEGIPYDSVIARRVFQRAGMTETRNLDLDLVPAGTAFTYIREYTAAGPRWRSTRYDQPVHGTPAGGGHSTAADMARFVDALRSNKLLSPTMTARMLSPKPELSSPNYGFGTQIFDPTANLVGHTGGGPGTAAFIQFEKTTGLTAIVISNNSGPSDAVARRIFATFPIT